VFLLVIQDIHNKPKFPLILLRLVEIGWPKSAVLTHFFALAELPLAFYIAVMR
jgi:hypothetical protein